MDMMMDPSIQLAESGAASALAAGMPTSMPIDQDNLYAANPILATAVSASQPTSVPVVGRASLSELALDMSAAGKDRLSEIMANVTYDDPASLIALNLALGEYVAETNAAAGVAAAEARALKAAAEKMLKL